ncbi:MAG: flagellar basal body rod protein FlgB [Pseudomonadota bacterium]
MIGKLDDTLRFHQTALSVRAERQQLLASNIANADTPNYKARDLDFNKALAGALGAAAVAPVGLARTSAAHLGRNGSQAATQASPLYRPEQQGSVDGNTVDMDIERNQFAENALRYEAGLTLVGAQVKGLLTAIQGQ